MKKFKKLAIALLCVMMTMFALTGCSIEKTSSQVETEALENIREANVDSIAEYTQNNFAQLLMSATYEQFASYVEQGQVVVSSLFDNDFGYRWKQFYDKHGDVISAEVDETMREGSEYTSRIILTGEDGEQMAMTITYDETMRPVSTTIADYADDSNETLGSKMKTAAGNTATGILVVFSVLVLLIFVISAFNLIPKETSGKKAAPAPAKAAPAPTAPVKEAPQQETIDLQKEEELVAVIAAAIAASENKPVDGFVVRSIKRLHNNKWR